MKVFFKSFALTVCSLLTVALCAQTSTKTSLKASRQLFLDVHELEPGQVSLEGVAGAHAKDLAVEKKYKVDFQKYWVDEKAGKVFCLASAPDSASITKAHAEAHGLLPQHVYPVTPGMAAALKKNTNLYLDIHYLGAGKVTADAVAAAHQKDLAVQDKYGVNLVNYWVDEKEGIVMCLAEARDGSALVKTHKEAHGLIPDKVFEVKQGN